MGPAFVGRKLRKKFIKIGCFILFNTYFHANRPVCTCMSKIEPQSVYMTDSYAPKRQYFVSGSFLQRFILNKVYSAISALERLILNKVYSAISALERFILNKMYSAISALERFILNKVYSAISALERFILNKVYSAISALERFILNKVYSAISALERFILNKVYSAISALERFHPAVSEYSLRASNLNVVDFAFWALILVSYVHYSASSIFT